MRLREVRVVLREVDFKCSHLCYFINKGSFWENKGSGRAYEYRTS